MGSRVALAVVERGMHRRRRPWSPWATILLMLCGEAFGLFAVHTGAPLIGVTLCLAAASGVLWIPRTSVPAPASAHLDAPGTIRYRGTIITPSERRATPRALRLCPSVPRDGSRDR
jgi:hypothetical protein